MDSSLAFFFLVHQRQRVHLQAAQSIINGLAENSGNLPWTSGASQSARPSQRPDQSSGAGAGRESGAAAESEPAESREAA